MYALVCLYSFYVFEKFQEKKFDHGTCMLLLVFFVILILCSLLRLWWHMLSLNATINLKCFSNQKAVRVKPVLSIMKLCSFSFLRAELRMHGAVPPCIFHYFFSFGKHAVHLILHYSRTAVCIHGVQNEPFCFKTDCRRKGTIHFLLACCNY